MSTIRRVIEIDAPADSVWDVIRDVGAVHTRLAPGFVVATQLEPDPERPGSLPSARLVQFANGMTVTERIVGLDPQLRRLAYAVAGGTATTHHNASFEVVPAGERRSQLVWTTDFLPDTAAAMLEPMIEMGSRVMKRTLEATSN